MDLSGETLQISIMKRIRMQDRDLALVNSCILSPFYYPRRSRLSCINAAPNTMPTMDRLWSDKAPMSMCAHNDLWSLGQPKFEMMIYLGKGRKAPYGALR